jgi:hypothetical protein
MKNTFPSLNQISTDLRFGSSAKPYGFQSYFYQEQKQSNLLLVADTRHSTGRIIAKNLSAYLSSSLFIPNQLKKSYSHQRLVDKVTETLNRNQQKVVITIRHNEAQQVEFSSHPASRPFYEQVLELLQKQEFHFSETSRMYPEAIIAEEIHIKINMDLPHSQLVENILHILSILSLRLKLMTRDHLEPAVLKISQRGLTNIFPHNRIELHGDKMTELQLSENDYVVLANVKTGKRRRCVVKRNQEISTEEIILGRSTKEKLMTENGTSVYLIKENKITFTKYGKQVVHSVRDGYIIVSSSIYNALQNKGESFELVNVVTGKSFDIPLSKIRSEDSLNPSTVKLSFLQRQFLEYEQPPNTIDSYFYEKFKEHPDAQEKFLNYYKAEKAVPKLDYLAQLDLMRNFNQIGYTMLHLYPFEPTNPKVRLHKRLWEFLLEKIIGQKCLSLSAIRPYSTDESSNAVRMSPSAMKLLGVDETDTIILKNRGKRVKARVLAIESIDLLRETNIVTHDSSMNISIGIPSHLRSELGLKNIGKVIEVERDLTYLFKKNLNLQFLPTIATILTAFTLNMKPLFQILLVIALVPLSVFLTFSNVREKINN